MSRKEHWETVYTKTDDTQVGWYQPDPEISFRLIEKASPGRGAVIDIGGGTSRLPEKLLDHGYKKIAVLDISAAAVAKAKARLSPRAHLIQWIVGDITEVEQVGHFEVWHDRAVFHFLDELSDRRRYVELAGHTLPKGGQLIIGTFAKDGPPRCSGLDVRRYDAASLAAEFGPDFRVVDETSHLHRTPSGKPQPFIFGSSGNRVGKNTHFWEHSAHI
ncbi:MAG: class I SAM-dependent methyltransferase [Phycisphaerae bacterium]|nr:class I SAM-dependent methyltransferase [Phycisphaerae bacterium]